MCVKILAEFIHGRPTLLNECLTSIINYLTCQAGYRSPSCNSSLKVVKLSRDVPWVKMLAEFIHGRPSSLNEYLN